MTTLIDSTATLERKFQGRPRDARTLIEMARQARGAAARWEKRSGAYAIVGEYREADDAHTEALALWTLADSLDHEVQSLRPSRHHATAKTARQLDREIAAALHARHRGRHLHHSTIAEQGAPAEVVSPSDMYMIAYDVLLEYEQFKKIKQEKTPQAQELIKRFHRIQKEIRQQYPDATPPDRFKKLYDKLTKPDRTYPQAQRDILANLAANGWAVSSGLKVPHATSPNGRLRLWFKPQAVWFTKMKHGERSVHGGTHNFKDARTISYDLDIRTKDPDALRDWMLRSSEA